MVQLVTGFATVFGLLGALALFCRRRNARIASSAIAKSALLKFPLSSFRFRKRDTPESGSAQLRVLKRVSLTPTHHLHLISIDSTSLLICTHPQGCSLLQSSPAEAGMAGGGAAFLAELRRHAG